MNKKKSTDKQGMAEAMERAPRDLANKKKKVTKARDWPKSSMMKKKSAVRASVIAHKAKPKKKNWIAGAIKKPGALHAEMGVKQGTKIPAGKLTAAAGKGGKLGQRARLAETLEGMHKKKGGKK